jgi:hypothetical protein
MCGIRGVIWGREVDAGLRLLSFGKLRMTRLKKLWKAV